MPRTPVLLSLTALGVFSQTAESQPGPMKGEHMVLLSQKCRVGLVWLELCWQRRHRAHLFCTLKQSPQCVEEGILIFCPCSVCFARELESRGAQSSGVVNVLQELHCSSVRRGRSGSRNRNAREAFLMQPECHS